MKQLTPNIQVHVGPGDVVAGLGCADRQLLVTCLALFDDSTLLNRLADLYDRSQDKLKRLTGAEIGASTRTVRSRLTYWRESTWSDDQLRLILWIYLREAFSLGPRLSVSRHGALQSADDLAAALINALDPPGAVKSGKRWLTKKGWLKKGEPALTLTDVILPVMDDLINESLSAEAKEVDPELRKKLTEKAISDLSRLSEDNKQRLMRETGATDLNDAALRNMLLAGGGLTAFGTTVGMAGFSSYILAAQASAYIPLVSGPGLVSFVSVVANPVTITAGTGVAIWLGARSAKQKVQAAISARVIALLALCGLQGGRGGIDGALQAFACAPTLSTATGVKAEVLSAYRSEWLSLEKVAGRSSVQPDMALRQALEKPIEMDDRLERENAAALTALTLGDALYNVASINPAVIAAADFSRIADIDGPIPFSVFAQSVLEHPGVTGSVSNLKGYVAEQVVASQLVAAGHTVSFPDASNQAGWDLLVDGQKFQVKFHEDLGGLAEHFEKYDYPVIANAELQDRIPEALADQVFFIDGLTNELVQKTTEDALDAGADLLDAGVPLMAVGISVGRGLMDRRAGRLSSAQMVEQVLVDGTMRVGLVLSGKVVGAGAGFVLFGPAGTWVLGAGLPIIAQTQTTKVVKGLRARLQTEKNKQWAKDMHELLDGFQEVLVKALKEKRRQLADKQKQCATIGGTLADYVYWRLADEGRFSLERELRLAGLDREHWPQHELRLRETLRWLAASPIHPACYQREMQAASNRLKSRPGLMEAIRNEPWFKEATQTMTTSWVNRGEFVAGMTERGESALNKVAEASRDFAVKIKVPEWLAKYTK